ncbi:MAG: hypothetical protein IPM45_00355 [Acidimicrobiales bacterium]|nr:hypothetical protein [Acidimicrobiales bacterium]
MVSRTSKAKREIDKQRKERAAAKRERREGRTDREVEPADGAEPADSTLTEEEVIRRLGEVHRRYDDGEIDLDELEAAKAELISQLRVE